MIPLSAFLLEQTFDPIAALADVPDDPEPQLAYWSNGKWDAMSWSDRHDVSAAQAGDIFVVAVGRERSAPSWQELLSREVPHLVFSEPPMSYGVIAFCAIEDSIDSQLLRWIAWCFGSGSRLLLRSSQDPRFGLKIALNVLGSDETNRNDNGRISRRTRLGLKVREMGFRTTAPYFQSARHRAARSIPTDGFRMDRASDLLASVGGRAQQAMLAGSVAGARSLRFRKSLSSLGELTALSATLVRWSRSTSYAQALPWVDNIQLVEDDDLIAELHEHLIEQLRTDPLPATVDALLPDDLLDVEDERAIRCILFPRERRDNASRLNLTIETIARRICRSGDPVAELATELRFLDDYDEVIGKVRLLDCICADLTIGDQQYLAYDGDFYKVDRTFAERIDTELRQLETSAIAFPAYKGVTEPQYIALIGDQYADRFVVLDRELIHLDGESGVEASDLVAASGALIHLKRKGKSSTLSHLFLQAANSCELLRRNVEARRIFADLVLQKAQTAVLAHQIAQVHNAQMEGRGLEVVFGFLGDWRGRTITSFPLFSRISLVYESRKVANLGFKPTIALIGDPGGQPTSRVPAIRQRTGSAGGVPAQTLSSADNRAARPVRQ
ncbi:DUF6119 family protein [Actinoplanes sp. NPDC051861]|uniref:DUF6119 family protein n=1 Tax=Actinoplanes sp. NPDC051861 TaxID=3155170 RepID=UPI003430655E